jgi:hypothetical protein
VPPIVAHELPEVADDQEQQHADADGVDQQDPVLPLREVVRVFGDLGEQQQRDEPQQYPEYCEQP